MECEGYKVDAIVYIPLNKYKSPNMSGWGEEDKTKVNTLLCKIPALDENGVNLSKNWIEPCIIAGTNIDTISILRQYKNIIKLMSGTSMNDASVRQFYDFLNNKKDENALHTAITISEMMKQMPAVLANDIYSNLKDIIKCKHLQIGLWNNNVVGITELKILDGEYQIEIWPLTDKFEIQFLNSKEDSLDCNMLNGYFNTNDYKLIPDKWNRLVKEFNIFEKEQVIESVKEIVEKSTTK